MNTLALLFSVLLCLAIVNCRSFEDRHAKDLSEADDGGLKTHGSEHRHRRRRWQANYGYDYRPSMPPYYPDARDYDRNQQQDLLPKIVRLLEEISDYIKRPQANIPPIQQLPQPVYIPVPYIIPQFVPCTATSAQNPNISSRFPEMEDTNQNWGFVPSNQIGRLPAGDGSRPISFEPIRPQGPMMRPPPAVEHGSVQAENQPTTKAPMTFEVDLPSEDPVEQIPVMCKAAVLSCCADSKPQQKQCFTNFGCTSTYDNGNACNTESVDEALAAFKAAYSPVS